LKIYFLLKNEHNFSVVKFAYQRDFWASSIVIFEYDNNGNNNQQPTTSTTNHQQALVSSNSHCFNVFPATFNGRQGFLRQQQVSLKSGLDHPSHKLPLAKQRKIICIKLFLGGG